MSNIMIHDLAKSQELDHQAMSAVRGGFADTSITISNNIGVSNTISNNIGLFMPINILTGSLIAAPVSVSLKATPTFKSNFDF